MFWSSNSCFHGLWELHGRIKLKQQASATQRHGFTKNTAAKENCFLYFRNACKKREPTIHHPLDIDSSHGTSMQDTYNVEFSGHRKYEVATWNTQVHATSTQQCLIECRDLFDNGPKCYYHNLFLHENALRRQPRFPAQWRLKYENRNSAPPVSYCISRSHVWRRKSTEYSSTTFLEHYVAEDVFTADVMLSSFFQRN